jgi:hypothetical protein
MYQLLLMVVMMVVAPAPSDTCSACSEDWLGGSMWHWFGNPRDASEFTCEGTDGGCHSEKRPYFCDISHNPCASLPIMLPAGATTLYYVASSCDFAGSAPADEQSSLTQAVMAGGTTNESKRKH